MLPNSQCGSFVIFETIQNILIILPGEGPGDGERVSGPGVHRVAAGHHGVAARERGGSVPARGTLPGGGQPVVEGADVVIQGLVAAPVAQSHPHRHPAVYSQPCQVLLQQIFFSVIKYFSQGRSVRHARARVTICSNLVPVSRSRTVSQLWL